MRAVGSIITGNDAQTQIVLDGGLLDYIPALIYHDKTNIVKETCWVVSNITAGNVHQIQLVIDSGIIPTVIHILNQVCICFNLTPFGWKLIKF